MNVGSFRHLITIERPDIENETTDEYGRRITPWLPVAQAYAAVADVSGREFYEAAAHQMENVVTFTTRWLSDLTTAMRIWWNGATYEIMQINHLGYKRDFIRIKARVIAAEGAQTNGQL